MHDVEEKLQALGLALAAAPEPMANYVSVQKAGNLWFFAGAGPFENGKPVVFGRLGETLTTKQGYEAARLAGINLLALLKRALGGDWDKLEQIVKVQGFVNSTNDFIEQPQVLDGVSDLFGQVLGARGRHARTAVAVNTLPFGIPVEVEMIVQVKS